MFRWMNVKMVRVVTSVKLRGIGAKDESCLLSTLRKKIRKVVCEFLKTIVG